MAFIVDVLTRSFGQVVVSLLHNWPYLLASVVIAVVLKTFVDAGRIAAFLARHRGAGVGVATAAAVGTPLCSCGTTAVVLGMMASTMPWAPIVAFMVASPLSSPEGMIYTAGLFGWPFAIGMFAVSIALGLTGGAVAAALEKRGLLQGQARLAPSAAAAPAAVFPAVPATARAPMPATAPASCGCSGTPPAQSLPVLVPVLQTASACGCASSPARAPTRVITGRLAGLPRDLLNTGGRLLAMFFGFAFIGFLLNNLIPAAWVSALFGTGKVYGVPLAATIGLPLYVSSEASLPMIRALLDSGMSQGAVMAFLIAGSGTSIGAIAGALTIARWRVVAVVVGVLWLGAMAAGFGYNLLLTLRII